MHSPDNIDFSVHLKSKGRQRKQVFEVNKYTEIKEMEMMNNLKPGLKHFTPLTRKTYDTVIKAAKFYPVSFVFQTSGMEMCGLDTTWTSEFSENQK